MSQSCWAAPGREDKEDLPEEEVQGEDGEDVEGLCGHKKSDDDTGDKKMNTKSEKENEEETSETSLDKYFQTLSPALAEKLFILSSTPCHEGKFVWDCELCLEMLNLDLKLSFQLDTEQCAL